jgi:hypothetical protein
LVTESKPEVVWMEGKSGVEELLRERNYKKA